jgi:hypothetical protein
MATPPPGTNVLPQWLTRSAGAAPALRMVCVMLSRLESELRVKLRTSCSPVRSQTSDVSWALLSLILSTAHVPKNNAQCPTPNLHL